MDFHLSISDDFVKTKMFDKRDEIDFAIVNFPFLDGDVPRYVMGFIFLNFFVMLMCPVMSLTLVLVIKFLITSDWLSSERNSMKSPS